MVEEVVLMGAGNHNTGKAVNKRVGKLVFDNFAAISDKRGL